MAGRESERYALIDVLAEEFAERWRRGERPALQEYVDRYPELADDIRELLPALAEVEQVKVELGAAPPDPPSAMLPLEQLGDYRIIREVGKGGMGIVYEAEQVSLARRVALKVLPKKMLLDGKAKQRFEREAKAAAKLHHTNIVPVFGVGEQDGLPYFVMQFIQGLGLDDVLEELRRIQGKVGTAPGALPEERISPTPKTAVVAEVARSLMSGQFNRPDAPTEGMPGSLSSSSPALPRSGGAGSGDKSHSSSSVILPGQSGAAGSAPSRASTYWQSVARIGVQVAEALDYAHKQGILHRDVKPSNLLLDDHATVWVTDFGLAKVDDQPNLTDTGDILGTLRYMPPEAFEGRADARSDVYALGLTLYELLAFRPGFDETDRPKLIKQVSTTEPPRLRKLNRQVPRDLETIVHKATDREPQRRYRTAGELAADLQRFINDEPIRARRLSSAERLLRWSRRNKGVATMTCIAAGLLFSVAIVSFWDAWRLQGERDAVLDEQRRANAAEIKAVTARTEALFTAAPESVPVLLESLRDRKDAVLPDLRLRRGQWNPASVEDLRLTVALAVMGEDCLAELCARVEQTAANESHNLMLGLTACQRDEAIRELNRLYDAAKPGEGRTRLSIALLTFGDARAAQAELAMRQNPTDRVRFIHTFRSWHGELTRIPELLRSAEDSAFRSGLCLAIGGVGPDKIAPATRQALDQHLAQFYTAAAEGGTHGAAAWALRRLRGYDADRGVAIDPADVALPDIATTAGPDAGKQWFINRQGMTMIALRPGFFEPNSYEQDVQAAHNRPLVVLTRPFYMLDQEVTREWYKRFLDSDDHPAGEEPTRFPHSINLGLPVAHLNWFSAVVYCNWLSRREGRTPCYRIDPDADDLSSAVACDFDANGYRLPTDAEWEYAFRTGTTTCYVTGDEVDHMPGYGRISAAQPGRGKEFMPNPWGLFDLLANDWEITWDDAGNRPLIAINPPGTAGTTYAMRGGTAEGGLHYLKASHRFSVSVSHSSGFRVLCGPLERGVLSSKGAVILAALDNAIGPPPLAALQLRAQVHAEAGQARAALAALVAAAQRWPRDNLIGLQAAPLYLMAGDHDGYRRHRRALLERFKASAKVVDLERTAKACLLLPGTAEEMDRCVQMTERALRAGGQNLHKDYFALAAALAQFRNGDCTAALARLAQGSSSNWNWAVPADLLRAMIFHRQEKLDAARDALMHACETMDRSMPTITDAGEAWHDVLICRILRREAEALLTPRP
jgi:serine/threonine protein kinase/formylglycine-generating enzyme required for sulfatase activity